MKDGLGRAAVERLGKNLALGHRDFHKSQFVETACKGIQGLELKDRVEQVAIAMAQFLPADYPRALEGICDSLGEWDRGAENDSLRGFASWPLFTFIARQGGAHLDLSLDALRDATHLFTAEFALRPFLLADQKRAMAHVEKWTQDPRDAVRRLASEGIRPRLPWAGRLPAFQRDPSAVLAILERLKDDDSEYVRRSVGNCLADIAVDHPDLVVKTCKRWMKGASPERRWIVKRGTRNLIKAGHPGVWNLIGFTDMPKLQVEALGIKPKTVALGEKFQIQFRLRSQAKQDQRLVVDFVVHHLKASGTTTEKVFKGSELLLGAGDTVDFAKSHAFRKISTRTYYGGRHRVQVQVNGLRLGETEVLLRM